MKNKKLFIAVPIKKEWQDIFADYQEKSGEVAWRKWEPLAKLHVTVLFLGTTDEELVPEIIDAMSDVVAVQKSFALTLEGMFYAPEDGRPNMIWAKWKDQPEFATLSARTKEELSYIVGQIEGKKPVKPHTTLARLDKSLSPKELPKLTINGHEGKSMEVDEVILMETVTTQSGSVFKPLASFKIGDGKSENEEEVLS